MSKGLVNLDLIIEGCRRTIEELKKMEGGDLSEELQTLERMEGELEGLKDKFFMKTVAAVPATKTCVDEVEKVNQALAGNKDNPAVLKQKLNNVTDAVEVLLSKAQMRGTTLT